jgi:hypothetical protein
MLPCRIGALAAVLALAAGCASFPGIRPGTPAPEIRATFGAPEAVWKNPDGSETWEYPLGPVGVQTYMITLEPEQTVREVRQVLTPEYLENVQPGMSRDEVRRMIGKPGETVYFAARDEEVWTWRIQEFHFRHRRFHALFDRTTGILRSTLTLDEDRPDGDRRGR